MKNVLSAFVGMVALLLASCARETPVPGPYRPDGETLQMRVEVPKMSGGNSGAKTRSIAPEEGEDRIQTLYLLFFEPSANGTGKFLNYLPVKVDDFNPVSVDGMMGMAIDVDIEFSRARSGIVDLADAATWSPINISDAYNILGIANLKDDQYILGSVDKWMGEFRVKDMSEREVVTNSRVRLPASITSDMILMHGRMEKPDGEGQLHMVLGRDLARFDVNNEAKENFDLVSVSVWNGYSTSSIWERGILDYSSDIERIRRHYQVNNDGNLILLNPNDPTSFDPRELMNDIRGGLYAFENQVSSPVQNDNVTTALIVGLRERPGTDFDHDGQLDVYYYRVNMTNDTGVQDLRRNYIYALNIKSVQEIGWATEEDAYLGQINGLTYTINEWQLDTGGLLMENEHSMLSIPTKKVTIGAGNGVDDEIVVELSVGTFTTLETSPLLRVQSQTYRPASIGSYGFDELGGSPFYADFDNNTLVIKAKGLDTHETERSGHIVISYAGLEASLTVVQSGFHDKYLNLTLPDGGISRFPAYAGISSGLISIEATGPWVARLVMSGFSFNSSTSLPEVKTLYSTDASIVTDGNNSAIKKFRVYTNSFNETQAVRDALVVVTLLDQDEDPASPTFGEYVIENDDYTALVRLSQANVEKIHLAYTAEHAADPNNWHTNMIANFDGNGNPIGQNKFWVVPGRDTNNNIRGWSTGRSLELSGNSDDRAHFRASYKHPSTNEEMLQGHSATDPAGNWVIVEAIGPNASGRAREAIVRVQVDQGTFADIKVVQQSLSMTLWPAMLTENVSPYGGSTDWISVDLEGASNETKYTLDEMRHTISRSKNGRTFQGHPMPKFEVRTIDDDNTIRDYVPGEELTLDMQFRVKFAQIYYPNRGITLGTIVTARVGEMTQTINAIQRPLTSRGVKAAARGPYSYGLYDGAYMTWWRPFFNGTSEAANVGWSRADNVATANNVATTGTLSSTQSAPQNLTYLHYNNYHAGVYDSGTYAEASEAAVEATKGGMQWMDANGGGITVITVRTRDYYGRPANYMQSLLGLDWSFDTGAGGLADAKINFTGGDRVTKSKIWHMFVKNPYYLQGSVQPDYSNDGNVTYGYQGDNHMPALTWPDWAVAVCRDYDNTNEAAWVVDPKHRIIYIDDAYQLNTTWVNASNEQITFAYALRIFATKTAQYGSSFSDMFIDPDWAGSGTVDPQAVPAPWDPYWGENALDLRDGNRNGRWSIRSAVDED